MHNYDFLAALLVGLLGGGHCFAMCGGVVGAFSQAIPAHLRLSMSHRLRLTLSYNLGRIGSYAIAGALVGFASSAIITIAKFDDAVAYMQFAAGLMMIAMGLYVGQFNRWLVTLEQLGQPVWRKLQPLGSRLGQVDSPTKALALGAIWGWLPCGLVYSTLTWALASSDPLQGATIMLGFGIGTLPALVTMGAASAWLATLLKRKKLRYISGLVLIAYGAQMAYIALSQFL